MRNLASHPGGNEVERESLEQSAEDSKCADGLKRAGVTGM